MDKLQEVHNGITDIDQDLTRDRTKLDKLDMKLDMIISQLHQLYDRLPRTEEKIKNAVADSLSDTIEPIETMVKNLKKGVKT